MSGLAFNDEIATKEMLQPVWDYLKKNPDTHKLLLNSDIEVSFEDLRGELHISFRNRLRRFKSPLLLLITTDDGKYFKSKCALQNPYEMMHDTVKGFDDSPGTSAAEKIAAYTLRIHETLIVLSW
tara:strand:- start:519 stop:893 length:375 start_codon:yes stop_codon:yes gene_type:complete